MTDFFLKNLCRVRHTNILITKVEDSDEFPRPVLEAVSGTCASVRLDSLISLAFKTSRSSMVSYIEGGHRFSRKNSVILFWQKNQAAFF